MRRKKECLSDEMIMLEADYQYFFKISSSNARHLRKCHQCSLRVVRMRKEIALLRKILKRAYLNKI